MVNIKLISIVFGVILLCTIINSSAQTPRIIEVGEDRLVSIDKTDFPLVEAHLAVNPKNPNNLLAASMVATKPDLSGLDCATFTSLDGGGNWKRRDFGLVSCADP